MFEPRLALASLSGRSDAVWARAVEDHVGAAFLGGIALCEPSREAAQALVERDREEFLPPDPIAFVDRQLDALADAPLLAGFNVRSTALEPIREVAAVCAAHDAVVEINAHCRQDELCAVGCGETLLRDTDRLATYVRAAAEAGAAVSVKVRAEVPGVDLAETARRIEAAGAGVIHVDAMDTPQAIADVATASELFVVANNGVRDAEAAETYRSLGADAVSVGRASDRPVVLERVRQAVVAWEDREVIA